MSRACLVLVYLESISSNWLSSSERFTFTFLKPNLFLLPLVAWFCCFIQSLTISSCSFSISFHRPVVKYFTLAMLKTAFWSRPSNKTSKSVRLSSYAIRRNLAFRRLMKFMLALEARLYRFWIYMRSDFD